MKLKHYTGRSFKEAIEKAKLELGEDIAILESQKVTNNGSADPRNTIQITVVDDLETDNFSLPLKSRGNDRDKSSQRELLGYPKPNASEQAETEIAPYLIEETRFLTNELSKLNRFVRKFSLPTYPEPFVSTYEKLHKWGVESEDASDLIQAAFHNLDEIREVGVKDIMTKLKKRILKRLRPYDFYSRMDRKPRVIALIGPAGSGRTRAIMKLALHSGIFKKGKTAILSTDTYGMGAMRVLNRFGQLTRVPVEHVQDLGEIGSKIAELQRKQAILIDLPGERGLQIEHVKRLEQELSGKYPFEVILVVPATADIYDTELIYRNYAEIDVDAVAVTKTDETQRLGKLLSVVHRTGLPLAFICNGRSIPEDIRCEFSEEFWKELIHQVKE